MGGSGLYKKNEVMRKKHLISKVLDQHTHAFASAQSDQGIRVFTVEKDLYDIWDDRENIWPTKFQINMSAQFEQDLCNRKIILFH